VFLRKLLLRLRAVADPHEVSGEEVSFAYGLEISPALRFSLRYGFIFPLGIGGLLLSLPGWRRQRLLYFYLPVVVAAQIFGSVQERYRLTLVPVLLLYAAAALVWLFEAFREKRLARASGGLGLILGLAVIQQAWLPLHDSAEYEPGTGYFHAGQVYAAEGRFDRAAAEMMRLGEVVGQGPRSGTIGSLALVMEGDYRALWAKELIEQGRREEARQQVEQAATAYSRTAEVSYPYYNIGLLYLKLDESAKARAAFDRFLTLEPEGPRADQVRRLLLKLKD